MLKIYDQYQKFGVKQYYQNYSTQYYNPHQHKIKNIFTKYISNIIKVNNKILDLACGDGLISRIILEQKNQIMIEGSDPFFDNKYCHYKFSFEDIAKGELNAFNYNYDMVICSYAFHLIQQEWKYDFLSNLALKTQYFIIITPSKKITIIHPLWTKIKEVREDKITLLIYQCLIKK
jgi:2-polyprenyl-3-methyl-5-hydroxy-6-metoxy-1,4-benzoquinol methylase